MEDTAGLKLMITNFYESLFESHAGARFEELLNQVHQKVTPEMNHHLTKEYSEEEIKQALDNKGDLKAPGVDGMPTLFYKQYWSIVGEDVVREVKNLLNGGTMPEGWNETIIVLIPKMQNPEKLKDLRPISLCTVVYKIASKVLSNQLKVILPEIISLNQSAFVPGHLITDNVLLAYELTHLMQTKKGDLMAMQL